jgi:hypothetical protein
MFQDRRVELQNPHRTRNVGHVSLSSVTLVEVEAEVALRLTVCRSVSQYVLVSSTLVGLATRYHFLSESCESCGLVSVGRPL